MSCVHYTVNEPPVKPLMSSPPDSDVEPTSTSTTIITASSTGEEGKIFVLLVATI